MTSAYFFPSYLEVTLTTFLLPVKNKKGQTYAFFLLVAYRVFILFVREYEVSVLLVSIMGGGNLESI